jgi:futalosine hydrolase
MIETCGLGPIAAGIRTATLLATHMPQSVMLVGIAGAYLQRLPIEEAAVFSRFACYGIGAGSGSAFQTASELGWSQWNGPATSRLTTDAINMTKDHTGDNAGQLLLTTCAASGCLNDVNERIRKFPEAVAEDMEAFSVAMACSIASVELTVIRGISNNAGDRNKANWKIETALRAAAELALSRISL